MGVFTWIPFYKELADKLLAYRDRQGELIAILKELKDQGLPVIRLTDKDKQGNAVPLESIDPFTFFASFNRGATNQNRRAILSLIKERLKLQADIPNDFDAIPVMPPMNSWFFAFQRERKPEDIPALWLFAEAIVKYEPEDVAPETFNRCLEIDCVGVRNLTMGMFWMRPETYLALDSPNRKLLDERGIAHEVKDWASYIQFLKTARSRLSEKPYEFSHAAYVGTPAPNYWIFQGKPNKYDVVGALRAGVLKNWSVTKLNKEIHPGDKVIVWVAGPTAGCYALATVTSEVHTVTQDAEEDVYRRESGKSTPYEGVTLRIDTMLWDNPIYRADIIKQQGCRDFPAGKPGLQGTNFRGTKAYYDGILALAGGRTGMRYWLYAPGRNAKYWDECWQKGIMLFGADELSDLSVYSDKAAIEEALKKVNRLKHRPTNDARAAWEFSHVLSPGDIVIAKKGAREYVGYGVVSGPYRHDPQRTTYRNVQSIRWIKKGEWRKKGGPIVQKALTDITKYPAYVQELRELIGIEDTATGNRTPLPLNMILYGPPGTGKTYALCNVYMERFTERAAALSREEFAADLVADLAWWQVITMVMLDLKTSNVSGILAHPLMKARIRRANNRSPRAAVWAHLQMHTKSDCPEVKYTKRYEPLLFTKDAESVWSIDQKLATEETPDLVDALKRYDGYTSDRGAVIKRYEFITFHQSYSYEDFVEGIKPIMSEEATETLAYEVKPGIFKDMVQRALADPSHDYALLIDEISRGNVANIFGELITLIEDDKRQGAPNELCACLPYSRDEFVVPKNLHLIGAMNTADRSVEALDTALRRRFTFIAMPPQPELIRQPTKLNVDLQKLIGVINARIEKVLDKDHCIGHSYFMGIDASNDPLAELRTIFATKILPLMEEYFYGDPAKIGMVLGERFVVRKDDAVEWAKGDWGIDEFEERRVYALQDPKTMKDEDYRAIYE